MTWFKIHRNGEQKQQQETRKTRRVIIDQTDAKIGINHVETLNVAQIGGTINNGSKATNKSEAKSTGQGQSIAIGFTGEDLEEFWGED